MTEKTYPLVSFCVKCYNQKDLIRIALESAFSQTYRPLEIVVSDDASTDGSADVIQEMIDVYQANGGDLPITFVRNGSNLGNLRNWQKCCEVAKGELLVKADGDDISFPNRVEEIVKAWVADGRRALIIYHNAEKIDVRGAVFGVCKRNVLENGPLGAVSTYSRKLYEFFGGIVINNRMAADDTVYGCRAKLLGVEPLWIDKILLQYRIGSGISSGIVGYRKFMSKGALAALLVMWQTLVDIDSCSETIERSKARFYHERILSEIDQLTVILHLWQGMTFSERLSAYRKLKPTRRGLVQKTIHGLLLLGCLSDPIFDGLGLVKYLVARFCTHTNEGS